VDPWWWVPIGLAAWFLVAVLVAPCVGRSVPLAMSRLWTGTGTVRDADLGDQCFQRLTQVIERRFRGFAVAHGSDTCPELGRCAPDTVLILFEGVRYVHGPNPAAHRPLASSKARYT
jgi:hypothetical protein